MAKLNASGTGYLYAGYLGGTSVDVSTSIAVDPMGNATSRAIKIPQSASRPGTASEHCQSPDPTFNGRIDAFVVKLDAAGAVELRRLPGWCR